MDVNVDTAILLAVLVTHGGYIQSDESLIRKSCLEPAVANAALEGMLKAGLINMLDASSGIIMTGRSIKMLRKDSTIENLMQSDFIDILRTETESDDLYNEATVITIAQRVKDYSIANPESRMGQFYEENRMAELSLCAVILCLTSQTASM